MANSTVDKRQMCLSRSVRLCELLVTITYHYKLKQHTEYSEYSKNTTNYYTVLYSKPRSTTKTQRVPAQRTAPICNTNYKLL